MASFKQIRDTLNVREKELLREVEGISEGLNLTGVVSKISEMEEEAKKVIRADRRHWSGQKGGRRREKWKVE